ncbi:hypothetical protein DE146DRAFT_751722 [Phaeosphaeria sp. MPI-PUGE-AT-0046c]|nr:hypothetical protein DE146DRAFT_751722 [Phaeosphaeria sp. MPI-PUGE-AT-0046c]
MAAIPEDIIVQDLMNKLPAFDDSEFPQHLWIEPNGRIPSPPDNSLLSKIRYGPWDQPYFKYFTAALPNDTMTGVLRHRLMRFNSTVECNNVTSSEFPSTCNGDNPCPWKNTRNRQEISEDAYVDVTSLDTATRDTNFNFTQHCNVRTVRGYFEMGNNHNEFTHGPLMDHWEEDGPSSGKSKYNDWLPMIWLDGNKFSKQGPSWFYIWGGKWRRPSAGDKLTDIPAWPIPDHMHKPWPFVPSSDNVNRTVSGPLMTSMVAMFGTRSFLASVHASNDSALATSQICLSGRLPFATYTGYNRYANDCPGVHNGTVGSTSDAPGRLMTTFMNSAFNQSGSSYNLFSLETSVFFANQAMLLKTVENTQGLTARPIYFGSGRNIQRPTGSLGGLIAISVLVFFQLLGLIYLAWYIYEVPTWTGALDALAIARITSSLDKGNMPAIGNSDSSDLVQLSKIDGLIGVVDRVDEEPLADASVERTIELGLGAPGLFHRRLAKFWMPRPSEPPSIDMVCQCEGCRRRRVNAGMDSDGTFS